jgi:hypothetical protein
VSICWMSLCWVSWRRHKGSTVNHCVDNLWVNSTQTKIRIMKLRRQIKITNLDFTHNQWYSKQCFTTVNYETKLLTAELRMAWFSSIFVMTGSRAPRALHCSLAWFQVSPVLRRIPQYLLPFDLTRITLHESIDI